MGLFDILSGDPRPKKLRTIRLTTPILFGTLVHIMDAQHIKQ